MANKIIGEFFLHSLFSYTVYTKKNMIAGE